MRTISITFFAATLIAFALPAFADTFRCPNGKIINTGESISEISIKCDPPSTKAKLSRHVIEWTYNQGPHQLVHYLVFRKGVLSEIRSGGYGR